MFARAFNLVIFRLVSRNIKSDFDGAEEPSSVICRALVVSCSRNEKQSKANAGCGKRLVSTTRECAQLGKGILYMQNIVREFIALR